VGPLRNGAPCRSTVANDPLEGIQIRIVKRPKTAATISARAATAATKVERTAPSIKTPAFGRYRDAEAAPVNGATKEVRNVPKAVKPVKATEASGKSERGTRSTQRS
jgi:hypothetical protein